MKAAAALGATYKWNKLEGVTNTNGTVYVAISEITEYMDKNGRHVDWASCKKDLTVQVDIALDKEACGDVYRGTISSDYNLTRLELVLIGKTADGKKRYDEGRIAHPETSLDFQTVRFF